MQLANCLVALGGHSGNTAFKERVTPAEITVLRMLHGPDSVTSVVQIGSVARTSAAERDRLRTIYQKITPRGDYGAPEVDALYPGLNARLPQNFSDIEPEEATAEDFNPDVEEIIPVEEAPEKDEEPPAPAPTVEAPKRRGRQPKPLFGE